MDHPSEFDTSVPRALIANQLFVTHHCRRFLKETVIPEMTLVYGSDWRKLAITNRPAIADRGGCPAGTQATLRAIRDPGDLKISLSPNPMIG